MRIKVISNSSRQEVEESDNGLKVHLKAVPMKGKANEELIELLSKHFGVRKGQVNILKGHKSNIKEVEII